MIFSVTIIGYMKNIIFYKGIVMGFSNKNYELIRFDGHNLFFEVNRF